MKLEQVIEFMPESIRAKISHRTFRPGEFVVRKGERADHVYILTKGTTRVSNEFASGQRYTFAHQTVPDLIGDLEKAGMRVAGMSTDNRLVECVEIPSHPWFIGVQFHPEFTSNPRTGHPLFTGFIRAAKEYQDGKL